MILKIINTLVYFAFFASIILVTGSTSIFFDETYATPAPLALFIVMVNHLLLLGSIVYHWFFNSGNLTHMDRISWRFPLLVVFQAIYVNLLLTRHYILAFISALFVYAASFNIDYVVFDQFPGSWSDRSFIYTPISFHLGWTAVLVIVTALEAFGVNAQTDYASVWTKLFAFLALFLLDRIAIKATSEMDFACSLAIKVGLSAIAYQQTSNIFIKCLASFFAAKDYSDYIPLFSPQGNMGIDEECYLEC